eukprot:784555-Rhodomonas_salina.1
MEVRCRVFTSPALSEDGEFQRSSFAVSCSSKGAASCVALEFGASEHAADMQRACWRTLRTALTLTLTLALALTLKLKLKLKLKMALTLALALTLTLTLSPSLTLTLTLTLSRSPSPGHPEPSESALGKATVH